MLHEPREQKESSWSRHHPPNLTKAKGFTSDAEAFGWRGGVGIGGEAGES